MTYVNCGCGAKYIPDGNWVNIDFNSYSRYVTKWNFVAKGLPFQNDSCDLVYCCHMLEHLDKVQACNFLKEANRCLKRGGVLRIVVPDLENVCKEYIRVLDAVCNNSEEAFSQYEYIIIELLDQLTRKKSGGEMIKYWEKNDKMKNILF